MELLIVGAGVTGSLTASLLRRSFLGGLTTWDKERDAGGRMSTRRDPNNPSSHVDVGAQYFSRNKTGTGGSTDFESLKNSLYEELIGNKLLAPYQGVIANERKDPSIQNYVAPEGAHSIVRYFLEKSKANIKFQHQFTDANFEVSSKKIVCGCLGESPSSFDGLILTMPVPQLLQLKGEVFESMNEDTLSNLSSVGYSSHYVLGIFYKECIDTEWSSQYIDDPVICFAAWDTAKRGDTSNGSTLSVHSSASFGCEHLEDDREAVKASMIESTNRLIPGLPLPVYSCVLFWRYCLVNQVYPGAPGCVVLSHDPLVVATGDGFTGSDFESCVKGALATSNIVLKHFNRV